MDDSNYNKSSITIDGEDVEVDAVKDPRIGKAGQWHVRGVYNKQYVMAHGSSLQEAFKNWEEKARESGGKPAGDAQP